jgi:molybdenum cofactor biosynthesis enzyme MoaA
MTPDGGVSGARPREIDVRNLRKSLLYAQRSGVSTILLTGKGEPTLYPDQISEYLGHIAGNGSFPFVEIQTNAILFAGAELDDHLAAWHASGLTTVSPSVVSVDDGVNAEVITGGRLSYSLIGIVEKLHRVGFCVRLNCTMLGDVVGSWDRLAEVVDWCREHAVEQLTVREVTEPPESEDPGVSGWIAKHKVPAESVEEMKKKLFARGKKLLTLPHGAVVFDLDGQNVCFNNCLTPPQDDQIRQIIFFPDGHLRYDWVYRGAILL